MFSTSTLVFYVKALISSRNQCFLKQFWFIELTSGNIKWVLMFLKVMLVAGVPLDSIAVMGDLKSDAMYLYLHIVASKLKGLKCNFSKNELLVDSYRVHHSSGLESLIYWNHALQCLFTFRVSFLLLFNSLKLSSLKSLRVPAF